MFLELSQEKAKGGLLRYSTITENIYLPVHDLFPFLVFANVGQIAFSSNSRCSSRKSGWKGILFEGRSCWFQSKELCPFCLHWTLMYHNGFSFLGSKKRKLVCPLLKWLNYHLKGTLDSVCISVNIPPPLLLAPQYTIKCPFPQAYHPCFKGNLTLTRLINYLVMKQVCYCNLLLN